MRLGLAAWNDKNRWSCCIRWRQWQEEHKKCGPMSSAFSYFVAWIAEAVTLRILLVFLIGLRHRRFIYAVRLFNAVSAKDEIPHVHTHPAH